MTKNAFEAEKLFLRIRMFQKKSYFCRPLEINDLNYKIMELPFAEAWKIILIRWWHPS